MKHLEEAINALIRKGKVRGHLTHDEIIDALSNFDLSPDDFDEILERLVNEFIEVTDEADEPPAPVKVEFDSSSRQLLKWATWIAISRGASEVGFDQVLAAARADYPPPEPAEIWDIPFSAQVQSGLAQAFVGAAEITRNDILSALGLDQSRSAFTLSDALGNKLRLLLEQHGIDAAGLWRELKSFAAHDCVPRAESSTSEALGRFRKPASRS